ncbi:hypothetical protein SPAN111604_06455 [Sphingomonas antarctica]|uniref:hypothetical protein n=1 Tax=Sphingomonas antarctica TaxID=2040274 RepID=UPI0039EBEF9E
MRNAVFAVVALGVSIIMPLSPAVAQPVDNSLTVTGERTAGALAQYQARVAATPGDETAWLNIAILQKHAGRTAEAQQAVERVMALGNAVVQNQFGDDVWTHDWAQNVTARPVTLALR